MFLHGARLTASGPAFHSRRDGANYSDAGAPGKAGTEVTGARWVNVVLGNLKRALDGTYHAFGFFTYPERYLAEAAWRFNHRFDLKTMLPRLLATAVTCSPWTEAALRNVPVYSRCLRWALIRSGDYHTH